MKKIQRSFVIEYKSGRKKADLKSNSIWGNMDLKSVARDVQEEAMPFLPQDRAAGSDASLTKENGNEPLLTPSNSHSKTATATQEATMADDNTTTISNDAPAPLVPTDAPKKQRKPRAKKAAPEAAAADVAAEPAAAGKRAKQVRGRKPKAAEAAISAKAPAKRAAKAIASPAAVPVDAADEMADLLQLEEENQRLRKLLAEKLRAENADLRKRLNLG